ncbi:carboxymuconolactone decarboxylase family protein [Streptomyces orinoci]|uniref:Carboxymuconolactone decarboxylase family protein n=1 Tax=Streptomyces orinoci TaxID=67339 RepID=A0ABV3K244_STRON|nr:carboxymuconolactone decarboxylase family protein [Streptomyces orinoci]
MTQLRHTPRLDFRTTAPKVFKAVLALDAAAKESLDPVVLELVQIRTSQLNHCTYCIEYHTSDARGAGETEQRIYQLSGWRESLLYTAAERAALALTEAVTLLPGGVPEEVYRQAAEHFDEPQLAGLISVICTANVWNRINVTTRATPGVR